MQKIETLTVLSTKISELVHETQKERGMTAGYLGSKGKKFKDILPTQRELSSKKFLEFKNYSQNIDFSVYPKIFKENINNAIARFDGLNEIRPKVDSLNITTPKAIAYYTKMNALILNNVVLIAKLSSNAKISRELTSYANFLLSKERAGIERAVGANTLGQDRFGEGMYSKLNSLINAQNVYMNSFLEYASLDAIDFYNKTLVGKEVNEVNRIRKVFLASAQKQAIASEMKELVGYGGIIHNFKNYIIRGTAKYETAITRQYQTLNTLIAKYKTFDNVSSEEKGLLNEIHGVFEKYYNGLPRVTDAINNKTDIKKLDKVVKVNDGPAIKALNHLTSSLFADPAEYWFAQITAKINRLKQVDNYLAKSLISDVQIIANSTYTSLMNTLAIAMGAIFLASLFGYVISKRIIMSLKDFQEGLGEFFRFLNYEIDDVKCLSNESKDEFGKMTESINSNINKTKENILQDRKLIDDTIKVTDRINKGYFNERIELSSANPALNELKEILNNTIGTLSNNLENIKKVLVSYTKLNYHPVVDKNNMEGVVEELIDGINILGESITETLVVNKRNGLTLESSAKTLLDNVDKLKTSSNEAAASLEETAAALEEITSIIISNTDNVTTMSKYATKVTQSVNNGEKLANNTMEAMDEINEQVTSINEAITVIDQIAFQTNILSLNAAVEAATAGEAGKGFSVVAQEVRNLATRSADAAREIKELVEIATVKANVGKEISKNMLTGYKSLNKDIEKTLDLIHQVDTASREQQSGLEQINGAVTELDQQTQMNASAALETNDIAITTQKLSETIVSEADKKEFRGKDEVTDRRESCRDTSFAGEEKRGAEAHIKSIDKTKRRGAVATANRSNFATEKEEDTWASF